MQKRLQPMLGAALAGIVWSSASLASAQTVLTHRDISAEAAFRVAQAAIAACKAQAFDVSVVILDREGNVRLGVRADSAAPHNYENAQRKAYTALTFRRPSAEWARNLKAQPELEGQRSLSQVIPLGGGLPIKIGAETIGSIGVSGSPNQTFDEGCAAAGLASIAADLK
jgi:uncharacterized protein GlcG (DUF336 family)